jgi:hypothetical protein
VLNLPLPIPVYRSDCGRIADAELVIRVAERDSVEAASLLMRGWRHARHGLTDAPDLSLLAPMIAHGVGDLLEVGAVMLLSVAYGG